MGQDSLAGVEVSIEHADLLETGTVRQCYWVWHRTIGGPENLAESEKIREAVAELPGEWPSVDEATVTVAVRLDSDGEPGVLNIYLPTRVPTGCAAHFSGPFHGDMSRTSVDFENPFNKLLIDTIAELSVDIVFDCLAGRGQPEFEAILDILARSNSDEGERWFEIVSAVISSKDIDLQSANVLFTGDGWNSLEMSSILPLPDSPEVITEDVLRENVTFPVVSVKSEARKKQLVGLFRSLGISEFPLKSDVADTLENIAGQLHHAGKDAHWKGFWTDARKVLDDDAEPLQSKRVLLGTDGQLHAVDEKTSVFFRPRSAGADDEVSEGFDVTAIPENLRHLVAFLNETIEVQVPGEKGGIRNTPVHGFLSQGLVETYGIERIFNSVLVKAVPKLPVEFGTSESDLCRDILHWALRLLGSSKGDQEESIKLLGRLPAPCNGGWFSLNETSFGIGWPGKSGEVLEGYHTAVGTPACEEARARLLLSPEHVLWNDLGGRSIGLLEACGVFDGLRLTPVNPSEWAADLTISMASGVKLPLASPPGIEAESWSLYRDYVYKTQTPAYVSAFRYQVRALHSLPGMESWPSMSFSVQESLMQLLLVSLPHWKSAYPSWKSIQIRKVGGTFHNLTPDSYLVFFLRNSSWLNAEVDDDVVSFNPSERWYIPAPSLLGGLHQFSHLSPIPPTISAKIGCDPAITGAMIELGMPVYNPEAETGSTRLLDDLARALLDPAIDVSNSSVYLGQVRSAWAQFYPEAGQGPLQNLVVSDGAGNLRVISPSDEQPVYLPDATHQIHRGLELHSNSLVAMEPRDAKRLAPYFSQAFDKRIRFASQLEQLALVDGEQWVGSGEELLLSGELPWLMSLVLTLVAFSGGQSPGVSTKRFAEALDTLRNVRVCWVNRLETCLLYDGEVETRLKVPALVAGKTTTILARMDVQEDLSKLADVLSSIVGRGDIDIALKLLLNERKKSVEYSDADLCQALGKLHIARDKYEQVQQRCLGDFAWKRRLWRPLILIFQPDAALDELESATNPEELFAALSTSEFPFEYLSEMTDLVAGASSFKSLGYAAWTLFGERAELSAWNDALVRCGETPITNSDISDEFLGVIESLQLSLRQLARALASLGVGGLDFNEIYAHCAGISCPPRYLDQHWELNFSLVMDTVVQAVSNLDIDESTLQALAKAADLQDLRLRMSTVGVDVVTDPLELQAENQRLLSRTIARMQTIAIASATKSGTDAGFWAQDKAVIEDKLSLEYTQKAFIVVWEEADCITMFRTMKPDGVSNEIWEAIEGCDSTSDIMKRLHVCPDDIAEANKVIENYRQAESRRSNAVDVCGSGFLNTADNLANLWEHISTTVSMDRLQRLDASRSEDLEAQKSGGKSKRPLPTPTMPGTGQKPKGRMTQMMKDLIGLAGEIHAYRSLRLTYGAEIVSPSNWISENSRHVFPENAATDNYGCDFRVNLDGKSYFFEVKASQSDAESFELGSSEIRLALECANKRKRQFRIVHVLNALSESPILRILPNPYDSRQQENYRFEEAGLRVRYHLSDVNHVDLK